MFKRYAADVSLLVATFFWGSTFVLVQDAVVRLPVFPFLAIRFLVSGLIMLIAAFTHTTSRQGLKTKDLWKSGIILGFWLFAGYAFQTIGLLYTTAPRSGFITGLSVALVPAASMVILKQRPPKLAWAGIAIATWGMFLLAGGRLSGFNMGDDLTMLSAVSFALQIVLVGKYAPRFSPIALASVQILAVGIFSAAASVVKFDPLQVGAALRVPVVLESLLITILLATVLAFFVQTACQKYTTPTHAALIIATEPVFAALFAYVWAGDRLSLLSIVGSAFILAGMLVTEFSGSDKKVPQSG